MGRAGSKIDGLTAMQQAFVEAYAGNVEEAALAAGYSPTYAYAKAHELLKNPAIVAAIKARKPTKAARARIATREERQRFWTKVMRGQVKDVAVTKEGVVVEVGPELKDRLKAAELLGKSEADFTEKVQHSGTVIINVGDPFAPGSGGSEGGE